MRRQHAVRGCLTMTEMLPHSRKQKIALAIGLSFFADALGDHCGQHLYDIAWIRPMRRISVRAEEIAQPEPPAHVLIEQVFCHAPMLLDELERHPWIEVQEQREDHGIRLEIRDPAALRL